MFIQQSKTNWKYILIIIILTAIVGGGILWFVAKQEMPFVQFPVISKKVIFSTGCIDIADLWTDLSQDKKIEECNKILNQQTADLKNLGFEPKDCEVIKAEAKHCTKMLGTQLVCTYSCKK